MEHYPFALIVLAKRASWALPLAERRGHCHWLFVLVRPFVCLRIWLRIWLRIAANVARRVLFLAMISLLSSLSLSSKSKFLLFENIRKAPSWVALGVLWTRAPHLRVLALDSAALCCSTTRAVGSLQALHFKRDRLFLCSSSLLSLVALQQINTGPSLLDRLHWILSIG